jgi:7-carboxy-7-deazaguanine synthase
MIRVEKTEGVYGPTIQGEGLNIGMPVTFVRLYGCSFRCKWCDTPYSLGKDMGGEYIEMSAEQIINQIKTIGVRNVVLSGGDPLLQGKEMDPLFFLLKHHDYFVQVETQGFMKPTEEAFHCTSFWSLSPKLPSAGEMESKNWKNVDFIIDALRNDYPAEVQLKFVVSDKVDYDFLKEKLTSMQAKATYIPIIIQPEGQQLYDKPLDIMGYLQSIDRLVGFFTADKTYWDDYDLRILPQLHKLVWGKARGV